MQMENSETFVVVDKIVGALSNSVDLLFDISLPVYRRYNTVEIGLKFRVK
jgi:hypothetical protein